MTTKIIQTVFENIKWLLFTNHCQYCNKLIGKDETLCEECREHLPRITGERCKFCGAGKERCKCKKHHTSYNGITAPFYYEGTVQEGIAKLKFSGVETLVHYFAKDMAESVKNDFSDINFDFICYVPFTATQKLMRKYNQCELLAEKLSKSLNIPLRHELIKIFETKTQHRISSIGRKGNAFGVYDVRHPEKIKGKTILLVDDIKTTGTTLEQCATILKIRGAEAVYCVTIALTGKKQENEEK